MSNLTRIKNNQITDSSIFANTKIAPGTIVGSLFSSNLVIATDITISGNLTVQGTSQYTTIASTNTYVNDPLIVLNNAFTGTNTYDIGLIFNRGNQTNSGFVWSESAKEFRLVNTAETGTTYGSVVPSSYGNLHIGNLIVDNIATIGTSTATVTLGNVSTQSMTLAGNISVNGGYFTSNAATFNLLGNTVTTVSAFEAATLIDIGASSGTTTINNNLTSTGTLLANSGAASISSTSGALQVNGGLGVTGNIYSGRIVGANNGLYSVSSFNGTYTHGIVVDYTSGTGRISVGPSDGITFYNGGVANTPLVTIASTGNVTVGNLSATTVTATNYVGTLLTAAQPNVTSVGTLTSLAVTGTATAATFSATTLTGTLSTAAQPNVTSVGTLVSLAVTGNITSGNLTTTNITGTLQTASQPNITTVGTLGALTVTGTGSFGTMNATNVGGTLSTAAQPNITSVGTLVSLAVTGNVATGNVSGMYVGGTLTTAAQPAITSVGTLTSLAVTGTATAATFSATTLTGTLSTAAQPNVTSVGTLTSLAVTGGVTAATFTGALSTASQTNITTVGNLTALSVAGATSHTGIVYANAGIASTSTTTGAIVVTGGLGVSGNIYAGSIISAPTVSATTLTGTLSTAAQPNVTSVGTLTSLAVTGTATAATFSATTLTGTLSTATQPNVTSVGTLVSLAVTGNVSAANYTGTLLTAAQPNVTSVGTLTSLAVTGTATAATFSATTLTGTLSTAAQPNVTSVGTLSGLSVTAMIAGNISGSAATVTGAAQPAITSVGTLTSLAVTGTATAATFSATTLTGTLSTAAQPNVTSVGTLSGLAVTAMITGNISGSAATVTGAAQTAITSVGNLTALSVAGATSHTGIVYANAGIASTSTTTGAIVVNGGVGISGNINVGSGAVFNASQTAGKFLVQGVNTTSLIYADYNNGGVVIGGSNAAVQGGTTLKVNGTGSMMIPVGTSAQRPGLSGNVDMAGMVRFNTSIGIMEFYDGSQWQTTQGSFTVVADNQFTASGSANTFVLSGPATTSGTFVTINGVVQIPVLAYTISGSTLIFNETPVSSDVIDARVITTTTTVQSMNNNTSSVTLNSDSYGNALVTIAGTLITTTTAQGLTVVGNINATHFVGDGSLLTGVVGTYGNAQVATYLPSYSGSIGGSLTTAAQTAITSVGTLTALGVSGAITVNSGNGVTAIINGGTTGIGNIGSATTGFNTVYAKATSAVYADLAENYAADTDYEPGTVLEFGGEFEVTLGTEGTTRVAGVVSTNPAYLMNSAIEAEFTAPIALQGRVPCKVIGQVRKGDLIVSAGNGFAKASSTPSIGQVIGKAIENFDGDTGVIEVVVGRV